MRNILVFLFLFPSIVFAAPEATVMKNQDGNLVIEFSNDTGQQLRYSVLAEGWQQRNDPNLTKQSQWFFQTSEILTNGYASAHKKGRKEPTHSVTISNVFRGLPAKSYQKLKLKIILEWDDQDPNIWSSPQCHISYIDITQMVEPKASP